MELTKTADHIYQDEATGFFMDSRTGLLYDETNTPQDMADRLIAEATEKATTPQYVTLEDGTTHRVSINCGYATEGIFAVRVRPVERRISNRKDHWRVTFHMRIGGLLKPVSKAAWLDAVRAS